MNAHAPAGLPDITEASIGRWLGVTPEPLHFAVADLIPTGMVTILVSPGGGGKTLLMQLACSCLPTGAPFVGKEVAAGSTAGVFAEDPEEVLHLRQERINAALGTDMEALDGRAFIRSYQGLDARLWSDRKPTRFMVDLEEQIGRIPDCRLLTLDNVALLFDGNENDRVEVSSFLNALTGMAHRLRVAVLLSTHASKSQDGSTLRVASGSTAWVNAARSVLELKPETRDDPPTLILRKANHARPGEEIRLQWTDHVLTTAAAPNSFDVRMRRRKLDRLIFERVDEAWKRQPPLSSAPQAVDRYLPTTLSRNSAFKTDEIAKAMQAWIDSGFLGAHRSLTARGKPGLTVEKWPDWMDKAA